MKEFLYLHKLFVIEVHCSFPSLFKIFIYNKPYEILKILNGLIRHS